MPKRFDLAKAFDETESDRTALPTRVESRALSVRIFETESELKNAFRVEFANQVLELAACNVEKCSFRYSAEAAAEEGDETDPVLRMIVHHYLHYIRDADPKVAKATLDRVVDIMHPPKMKSTAFDAAGVLTEEEMEAIDLDAEWEESDHS